MAKLKKCGESLIVISIGLFIFINSLNIRSNPIKYKGWTNVLAQAKFMPIVMSVGIMILGVLLFTKQYRGLDESAKLTRAEWLRMGGVLVLVAAYCVCVHKFKFLFPTIVFSFAVFFFLNWKSRKVWLILLVSVAAIVLGLYLLPLMINLRLPLK